MNIPLKIAGAAALAVLLAACRPADRPSAEQVRPVVTAVVQATSERTRVFTATARPELQTPISFRVGGLIETLPAKTGRSVRIGDLIARLESKDMELALRQAEAQLSQLEAQFQQARAEFTRIRQQYEARLASKSELDAAQASFNSAGAGRESALKSLELARRQLEYCTLLSPLDGAIVSVSVEAHQTVSAGQTVATLAAGDRIEVVVGIPDSLITLVKTGMTAATSFEAVPKTVFTAEVSQVAMAAEDSGAYPVKLRLQTQDERLRPGMIGEAVFRLDTGAAPWLTVPPAAVLAEPEGGRFVWVFDKETGAVRRREITVGHLVSEGLQVRSGLQTGEIMVIRGVHQLQDGMKVRLLE